MPDTPIALSSTPPPRPRWHLWCAVALAFVCGAAAVSFAAVWAWHRAQPNARALIVDSLQSQLHCKVEIDRLDVSLRHGLEVSGSGLRIESIDGTPHLAVAGIPMLTVASFHFQTTLHTLLFQRPSAVTAYASGVIVTIPPQPYSNGGRFKPAALSILRLHSLMATDSRLILETGIPTKSPVEFDFREIALQDLGVGKPFAFNATLTEPKPIDIVHATGHLGPWSGAAPRETPIDGEFRFDHVDVGYLKGLSGTMAVAAKFNGSLGHLVSDGTADIPDFALETSTHPAPVHVEIHASVDNGTGDVVFTPATVSFLHTVIAARGSLTQTAGTPGHDTELDIAIDRGREEEMLAQLSKSKPPLLGGDLTFRGKLSVPPGPEDVIVRSHIVGVTTVRAATWGDPALQQNADAISLRAQGRAREAKANPASLPVAPSQLTAQIEVRSGTIHVANLIYTMPGTSIVMNGTYPLLSDRLDFHGVARTAARASQLTTGWKSLLLKPVDPMLGKHGAGTELPVKLVGDKSAPKFGLDLRERMQDAVETRKTATEEHK